MALKGHATIELTSADGSVEKIEHDNIITKAPSDLLKGYMGDVAPICKLMARGNSFMQELFGGILLFSDSLDSDPDNYAIPNGKVVGYASQDAYAGANTARGSYNETESGVQDDGSYRFVWDFATSQANGTIKALALVPNKMGKVGLSANKVLSERFELRSNPPGDPFNLTGKMLAEGSSDKTEGLENQNFWPVAIDSDNGIAYAVYRYNIDGNNTYHLKNNGGVLRLYRFKVGITGMGASESAGMAKYIDYVDVTLPSDFVSVLTKGGINYPAITWTYLPNDGKLILFPFYGSSCQPGGTIKYVEVDFKNGMNVSSYTFTNNTGCVIYSGSFYTSGNFAGFIGFFWIFSRYVLVSATNGENKKRLYRISRTDNTDVKELKLVTGEAFSSTTDFSESGNMISFHPIFFTDKSVVFAARDGSLSSCMFFVDFENGIVQKTDGFPSYTVDNNGMYVPINSGALTFFTGNYMMMYPYVNPFVLCTKNNLDTAVTKTASQTMKITYTLTESEDA